MTYRAKTLVMVEWWMAFVALFCVASVTGQTCQQSCDCGFDWDDAENEDLTLRYEVFAGLVGAFSPLVLAGLGVLTYRLCRRPTPGTSPLQGSGAAPMATGYPQAGNKNYPGGGGGNGSYATSLYGESEDDFGSQKDQLQGGDAKGQGRSDGGGRRPGTVGSHYTNIHRNVKSDMTNQWLRNVNLRKY